jgi:hypothetical protein
MRAKRECGRSTQEMNEESHSMSTSFCKACTGAIVAALLSLTAFVLYGRFHSVAFRARHFGTDPGFVSYQLVDMMKTSSAILAVGAILLVLCCRHRHSRVFRLVALILALLACLTIPIIT